jgi:hypothetical protein
MIGTGEGTRTREREFLIVPDQFKRLGVGDAVLLCPSAERPGELIRVWSPRALSPA